MGRWGWMGVGRPRPPMRNDIVTPRHLFYLFIVSFFHFLVAVTQLYRRLCPSVHSSVHWSVHHARVVTFELKTRKTRIFDAAVGIVCV